MSFLQVPGGQESSGRRKTSKYFPTDKQKPKDEKETQELPAKRKNMKDGDELLTPRISKKIHEADEDESSLPTHKNKLADSTPTKKLKSESGRGIPQKPVDLEESDEANDNDTVTPVKSAGRGRGGRGTSTPSTGGRGRGGGRGGFMNFGERKDPPHKGEKVHTYQASGSIK